ncbi:zinc finger protein 107-like isoform X2 [Schistocerca cancellata]|uniref:zinc finger protein 107-like isoform X2 n=1 Tax=Schistocerca cancellata TaxID=274614 RepID=UPI00211888CB|nr:zinc finger protein 107-like isoform X2 [Schistocerca cancellata]XP_049770166.1 zinc finger protein 107-like isoform X2 [Schistocerca cancellata]
MKYKLSYASWLFLPQAQVYPFSMNVKEELEDSVNKEFLEDPLKTDDLCVLVKRDPELKQDADGSELNPVKDPLGISWSTDFVKEEPQLNLEINVTENIVETSTRYTPDTARLTQSTGRRCGISCEITCHHGLLQNEFVTDMEKSTQEFGTCTEDVTVDKKCSVATQHDCSKREKELHVYSCNFCQQGFPSKYRLIKHVFMHIDGMQPPLYVCKWCGEVFNSNVSLKKHLRMSDNYHVLTLGNSEKYGCSDEYQSNILLDSLSEVSVTEHNVQSSYKETWKDSKKSSNDMCNTHVRNDAEKINDYGTLSTVVNVSAQADRLTGHRTDKCGICGKLCGRSGHLKRDKLNHMEKKPHKCGICDKSFAQSDHLKTQILIHTVKEPHKCEICGKCFTMLGSLRKHALIHTGKKLHNCEICGNSFARADHLKTHILIHTGKKSHKCEICGKSFAISDYLKRRFKSHW